MHSAKVETIRADMDAAPEWQPEDEADADSSAGARQSPRSITATPFVLVDPATLPPRRWLYGRHLIRQFCSTTLAAGGVGKTGLAVVEALAMATGRPLLGEKVHERCRVWLWNGEDPIEEMQRRIAAACIHYAITPQDIIGRLFLDSGRDTPIVLLNATRDGLEIAEPVIDAVIETIRQNGIDAMTVDPFVTTHTVAENDNMAIDRAVRQWARIADVTGAGVDLVHHLRKGAPGQDERTVEDGRGAVALIAAVRSARVLNRMSKDEGERAGVGNHRSYFRVDNGKANLAPPADDTTWREIVNEDLPNGDSIGVVKPWTWPGPLDGLTVNDLVSVQRRIAEGHWRENAQAKEWVGIAVAEVLDLDLDHEADKAKVKGCIKAWLATGALNIEEGEDAKRNRRKFVVVGEWANA